MKRPTIYYGWFVVLAGFIATFTLGEASWSFGVFFKSLANEFGWSRAITSSGYTAFIVGYAISTAVTGKLADRYSPRPILFIAALVTGFGIIMCSRVQSIDQLRLVLLIAGLGGGATMTVPSATVQRWFHGRQETGLALAIVISGVGAGALFFAPLINYLILSYGWRNAYLIVGILFLVSMVIASLVIRQSPQEARAIPVAGETGVVKPVGNKGWTTGRAMTSFPFLIVTFCNFAAILAFQVVTVHLIPHATDVGVPATFAAAALGLMGGFSVPGRILSGYLSGKLGWQKIMTLAFLGMALSTLLLVYLRATWMLYCFVLFYGMCHGARATGQFGILGQFFGMRSLGTLIGIMVSVGHFIGAFAPYVAGFIFDTTGSYFVAFVGMMVLLLTASLAANMLKEPSAIPE
ncbi:MFS transporter [Chloroflexota bacterium]